MIGRRLLSSPRPAPSSCTPGRGPSTSRRRHWSPRGSVLPAGCRRERPDQLQLPIGTCRCPTPCRGPPRTAVPARPGRRRAPPAGRRGVGTSADGDHDVHSLGVPQDLGTYRTRARRLDARLATPKAHLSRVCPVDALGGMTRRRRRAVSTAASHWPARSPRRRSVSHSAIEHRRGHPQNVFALSRCRSFTLGTTHYHASTPRPRHPSGVCPWPRNNPAVWRRPATPPSASATTRSGHDRLAGVSGRGV